MSLSSLVLLIIPLVIIAILIKITSKGKVIFCQERIGKDCKIFTIYKFRTMYEDTPDIATHLLQNAEMLITPIGKFLRRTSLDELPQLLNILRGDMSVVGPRPALWNQDDLIAEREKYGANSILPGLTGLAQISGRDELSTEMKAKYDGEYKEKMGLFIDLKIIFLTAKIVLTGRGIFEGKNKHREVS